MNTPEPKAEAMKPYEDCDPLGPLLPSELHQAAMMQQNLISAYGPLGLRSEIAQLKERVQELEKENSNANQLIGDQADELGTIIKRLEKEIEHLKLHPPLH